MSKPIYSTLPAKPSTMVQLHVEERDTQALLLPLPSSEEYFLPSRKEETSRLAPGTIIPHWQHHMATYHATILEFLLARNIRVNIHQIKCFGVWDTKSKDVASYLRQGWNLFDAKNELTLFGSTNTPSQNKSLFDTVWSSFDKTWKIVFDNDISAPWRDYMVRQTLMKRGDFEIRFYLFQTSVVEYFTTVALARTTLSSEQDIEMPFAEQEYAVWCTLTAATLLLFKGKGLSQMDLLEHALDGVFDAMPAIKTDVNCQVRKLLELERGMRYTLSQLDVHGIVKQYVEAYRGHAERVVQLHQALGLPLV